MDFTPPGGTAWIRDDFCWLAALINLSAALGVNNMENYSFITLQGWAFGADRWGGGGGGG